MKHDPHLVWLAKEPTLRLNPKEGKKRELGDGEVISVKVKGNAIVAKMNWDERVAENTLVLPLGFENEIAVHELGTFLMNGEEVEITPALGVKSREWGVHSQKSDVRSQEPLGGSQQRGIGNQEREMRSPDPEISNPQE